MHTQFYLVISIFIALLLPACTNSNRLDLKGSDKNGIPLIRASWGAEDSSNRVEFTFQQTDGVSSQSIPNGKFIDLGSEIGIINGPETVQSDFQLRDTSIVYKSIDGGPPGAGVTFAFLVGLSYTNIDIEVSTPLLDARIDKSGVGLLAGIEISIAGSDQLRYSIRLTEAYYFGGVSAKNTLISISASYSLSPELDLIAGLARWDHENYDFLSELDFSVRGLMLGLEYKL